MQNYFTGEGSEGCKAFSKGIVEGWERTLLIPISCPKSHAAKFNCGEGTSALAAFLFFVYEISPCCQNQGGLFLLQGDVGTNLNIAQRQSNVQRYSTGYQGVF